MQAPVLLRWMIDQYVNTYRDQELVWREDAPVRAAITDSKTINLLATPELKKEFLEILSAQGYESSEVIRSFVRQFIEAGEGQFAVPMASPEVEPVLAPPAPVASIASKPAPEVTVVAAAACEIPVVASPVVVLEQKAILLARMQAEAQAWIERIATMSLEDLGFETDPDSFQYQFINCRKMIEQAAWDRHSDLHLANVRSRATYDEMEF